jgi:UDP-N-acetylglucosamine 4,6-dehydratase
MITEDDARSTYDIGDRYVITPEPRNDLRAIHGRAELVRDGFRYSSDNNTQWIDDAGLRAMCAGIDREGL